MPVLPVIPADAAATTLADLIARTRQLLAEPEEDFFHDDTDIVPELNNGMHELFADVDAFPRLITGLSTTPDTAFLRAPDRFSRMIALNVAGSAAMTPMTPLEYAALADAAGKPTRYGTDFMDAGGFPLIVVYPTPQLSYVLEGSYYAIPPELSDEQGPTWHRRFHFLICYYAASRLLPRDNKMDEATQAEQRWEQGKVDYRKWLATKAPYRELTFAQMPKGTM